MCTYTEWNWNLKPRVRDVCMLIKWKKRNKYFFIKKSGNIFKGFQAFLNTIYALLKKVNKYTNKR